MGSEETSKKLRGSASASAPSAEARRANPEKLKIKFIVPETDEADNVKEENSDAQNNVCPFCGKGFSSGKALGGHKRVHFQNKIEEKGPNSKKKKNPKSGYLETSDNEKPDLVQEKEDGESKHKCCVCGKGFSSDKSLFGHMRSHPEREWRGVNPPLVPEAGISSSSSVTNSPLVLPGAHDQNGFDHEPPINPPVNLLSYLSNWSKTDKRGRMIFTEAIEAEAAQILSCLHFARNSEEPGGNEISREKKRVVGSDPSCLPVKKLKIRDRDQPSSGSKPIKERKIGDFQTSGLKDLKEKGIVQGIGSSEEHLDVNGGSDKLESKRIYKQKPREGVDISKEVLTGDEVNVTKMKNKKKKKKKSLNLDAKKTLEITGNKCSDPGKSSPKIDNERNIPEKGERVLFGNASADKEKDLANNPGMQIHETEEDKEGRPREMESTNQTPSESAAQEVILEVRPRDWDIDLNKTPEIEDYCC